MTIHFQHTQLQAIVPVLRGIRPTVSDPVVS